jgi:centromere protein J
MEPYSNYFTGMDPEVISMQVNYLRMLANYYKSNDTTQNEEPQENLLEKSLRAESVFLQNDIIDVEAMPNDGKTKEVLTFSPPSKKTGNFEKDSENDFFSDSTLFRRKEAFNKELKQNDEFEEDFVVRKPIKRQVSYGNDEQPIKAGGSFEQLLERELKKTSHFEPSIEEPQVSLPPRIKSQRIIPKVKNDELPLKRPEKKSTLNNSEIVKSRKSLMVHSNLNQSEELLTPKTKPSEGSPKPKAKFLKRGQGKLCVDRKSVSKPSSVNTSKILFTEKSEILNEMQFFEKEEDPDKALYLDEQIKHYHSENNKLQKLVKEVEDKKKRLDRERAEFLKEKEKKLEELEKLKYEKKLRVQMKEKDEIAELKKIIQVLEKEKSEIKLNYENLLKKTQTVVKNPQPAIYSRSNSEPSEEKHPLESDSLSNLSSNENNSHLNDSVSSTSPVAKNPSIPDDSSDSSVDSESNFLHRPSGGKKEIQYSNGIKKEVYPDGYSIVYFNNKDIKQSFPDGRTVYHYSEAKTIQTTFPDGLQLFKFANGQIEKHFPDGSKEISFQDGTVKCVYPDGQEESVFPDGTVQTVDSKGVKFIEFVNGQRDTIYPNGVKIRKYPDGRVKKIMPDGKVLDQ